MPIQVLSKMMGHSSISVTMDLYVHLYVEDMQNAAAQFGAYLAQQ